MWGITATALPPFASRERNEKMMAAPIRKRNVGNTISVGVQPFHCACFSGQYECSPPLFTRIMKAIVNPRSTSTEITREDDTTAGASTVSVALMPSPLQDSFLYHCLDQV